MSWTKRQFVTQAYEELGLASYVFDLSPEQLQSAARKLDSMIAQWDGKGIRIGFPISPSPENIDIDTETGVAPYANEAIALNLAIRIAPSYGKTVFPETKANAKIAYETLLGRAAMPPLRQFGPLLPAGSGNKAFDYPFLPNPNVDPIQLGDNGQLEFLG